MLNLKILKMRVGLPKERKKREWIINKVEKKLNNKKKLTLPQKKNPYDPTLEITFASALVLSSNDKNKQKKVAQKIGCHH